VIVRKLTPMERWACAAILEAAWNAALPDAPRNIDAEQFATETVDELVLVAVANEGVIGFASIYAPDSFLHHLYVDPRTQGQGIGSLLLRESAARVTAPLTLKCQIANTRARAFYAKHGFAETGCGSDKYGRWVRLLAPSGGD